MLFVRGVGIAVLALGLGTGCAGEQLAGVPETPYQAFASVRVTPGAVALAVGATQQLTVVALDTSGTPLTGVAAPKFSLNDPSDTLRIQIDSNGMVHGIAAGVNVRVNVSIQHKNVTYTDVVFVTVTAGASQASSLTISPDPMTLEAGQTQGLTATARTSSANGAMEIFGLGQAHYVSSDPGVATVEYERITAISPGQATIIGRMTIDGTDLADTITVTVTYPTTALVFIYPADDYYISRRIVFQPPLVRIAAGGTVMWANYSAYSNFGESARTSMDVTFDNAAAVPEGNIPAFTEGEGSRTFPTAGTYTYRSTTNGATGTVIVQ